MREATAQHLLLKTIKSWPLRRPMLGGKWAEWRAVASECAKACVFGSSGNYMAPLARTFQYYATLQFRIKMYLWLVNKNVHRQRI